MRIILAMARNTFRSEVGNRQYLQRRSAENLRPFVVNVLGFVVPLIFSGVANVGNIVFPEVGGL